MSLNVIEYDELRMSLLEICKSFNDKSQHILQYLLTSEQRQLILLSSRIKSLESINQKIHGKQLDNISDLIGFRVLVPSKKHVIKISKIFLSMPGYTLVEKILYTDSLTDAKNFRVIGFNDTEIKSKESGYVGVHLIFYKNDDLDQRAIELQVRTHLEHGLFVVDHPIYKASTVLNNKIEQMRAALVASLEGVAAMQESLIELCDTKTTQLNEFNLESDAQKMPPIKYVGQLIRISTDPKIYLVTDVRTIRWTKYNKGTSDHLLTQCVHTIKDTEFVKYSIGPDLQGEPRITDAEISNISQEIIKTTNEIHEHYKSFFSQ